jgi:hypothetical protein
LNVLGKDELFALSTNSVKGSPSIYLRCGLSDRGSDDLTVKGGDLGNSLHHEGGIFFFRLVTIDGVAKEQD